MTQNAPFALNEAGQTIFDMLPMMAHAIDAEGTLTHVSFPWLQTLGYERGEAIGRKSTDFMTPESQIRAAMDLQVFLRTGIARHPVYQMLSKGGDVIDVVFSAAAQRDESGRIVGCWAFLRDITDVKNRERALLKQKTLLERAEKIGHIGYWQIDVWDGNKVYWSPEIYVIHGLDPDSPAPDLEGAIAVYHPDDRPVVQDCVEHAIRSKQGYEFSLRLVRPSGEIRFVHSIGECEIGGDGKVRTVFGIFFDETERKMAERQLLEANEDLMISRAEAQKATKAKSEFLAKMSHEIRTPLNGLVGFAELLQQTKLDDYQSHCVRQMHAAGRTLARLVDDILEFSRIEAGKIVIEKANFSFERVVEICCELVRPEIEKKGLGFTIGIDASIPDPMLSDQFRLQQVFLNLLTNAVEFTPKGKVEFNAWCEPGAGDALILNVIVRDTGIGVPKDKQDAIFGSFTQLQQLTNRTFGGTGLGLAVVRQIVELMNGSIVLDSDVGKGSSFHLKIPVERASETGSIHTHEPLTAAGRTGYILVAEDIPMNQEVTLAVLAQKGHQVQIAQNGKEAVEAVKSGSFDMVLMDIQMPEMNGIEATRAIREELGIPHADLPIVALTAHALPDEVKACYAAGMDDYLTKPLNVKELYGKVDYWLNAADSDSFEEAVRGPARSSGNGRAELVDEMQLQTFIGFIGAGKMADIVVTFKSDFEAHIPRLSNPDTNPEDICKVLHALTSTSGNLGLSRLSLLCRDTMTKIKSGETAALSKDVKGILDLYKESSAAIDTYMSTLT